MLFPPLGLASLSAQLRKREIETRIFDCTFRTPERVKKDILAYQPDIVGISSMILLNRNTFTFAEFVRQALPQALLVAGGPMPTLYPERYADAFDLVFTGEADLTFPNFCQDYLANEPNRQMLDQLDLSLYPGIYRHTNGMNVDNPVIHFSEREVRAFPIPDRSDFNHQKYQAAWLQKDGSRTTSIMVTIGCPFDCDFCSRPVFGRIYRKRDLDMVFEEIAQLRRLGYDSLWIADDNFTLSLSLLQKFCQRMLGQKMRWSCLSRSTGITPEIARLMKQAGCFKVYLGLESGSNSTLRLMNKRATVDQGIQAIECFHEAGVQVAAFFIVGYPGETTSSIEQTFKLALEQPLDEISFNVPFPLPGSPLFERVSGIDPGKDWRKENEITFIYSTEFDPRWIKHRIRDTLQAFAQKKSLSRGIPNPA
jgi:anaerobic magnesium-protoporphyrin IX monomethyl ester cyclase